MISPSLSTDRLLELDRAHLWHPYSSLVAPPPVYAVSSAEGVRIKLSDGRELIDGVASWWSAIHGYNHPVLNAAAEGQLQRMAHVMFGGFTHEPAVKLAKLLVDIAPPGLNKLFFSDSGSVAVEVAIKMAVQYWHSRGRPEKHRLATVRRGYHGDTWGAMAVCDPDTGMHHLFSGVLPTQLFAESPGCGFNEPWNEAHIADMRHLLERHHGELAAVILEPVVQATGGMNFYSPQYLRALRALCDEYEVLLIHDEIATGFGRTGTLFASEHAGISPDILCIGKALTGGYISLAATLCSDQVAAGICEGEAGVLMHGPTFMANPLATAIAGASVELLLSQPWARNLQRIEAGLRQGLAAARDLPAVREVRVLGGIGVIEMKQPVDMPRIQAQLVERGIWVRPFGRLIYTIPPYIISDEDLATLCRGLVAVAAEH